MKVSRWPNERLVYRVISDSSGEAYRVDLEDDGFRGVCSCPHFRCRLAPARRQDRKAYECKHIKVALMAFARDFLQRIRAQARLHHGTGSMDIGPT